MTIRLAFIDILVLILHYTYLEEDPDLKDVYLSFVIDSDWKRDLLSLSSEKITIVEDKEDTLQKEGNTPQHQQQFDE